MADNSAALRRARRLDSRVKRQRATDAIGALEQAGEPITFPAVARRARVSVSLLYTDPELATRIATARDRQHQAGDRQTWKQPVRSLVTEQSLRTDLANAKEQVRQLTEEVALLRQRLAQDLGATADIARGLDTNPVLTQLEQRAAELEADNHQLRRQATRQDEQIRELTDTLDAARATNRDLMSQLNRSTASRRSKAAATEIDKSSTPSRRQ
jgi:chromosome segregation ATPase